MGETKTSVKEVIPEVGGRFTLDENVINRKQPPGNRSKPTLLMILSFPCGLESH